MGSAKERLRAEAMRLFGERGYAATSVADIEAAAGLRPGAGGLYAHYRSKEALLRAGLEALLDRQPIAIQPDGPTTASSGFADAEPSVPVPDSEPVSEQVIETDDQLPAAATSRSPRDEATLVLELEAVARAGLERLRHDRDYNRILVRDLRTAPDLLEMSADLEIRPVHDQLEAFLSAPHLRLPAGVQPRALAAVLIAATSHYWLLSDVFGEHPAGVDEEQFVGALARLTAAAVAIDTDAAGQA